MWVLNSESKHGFSTGHRVRVDKVSYLMHEYGTEVVDRKGNHIGDFPTETEAVEYIRDISRYYFEC